MNRPTNARRMHFANIAAIAAALQNFPKEIKGMSTGFSFAAAIRSACRVAKFYGGTVRYPRGSEREKLRRKVGGFARLHNHYLINVDEPDNFDSHSKRDCPICDRHLTHTQAAAELGHE